MHYNNDLVSKIVIQIYNITEVLMHYLESLISVKRKYTANYTIYNYLLNMTQVYLISFRLRIIFLDRLRLKVMIWKPD